MRRIVFGLGAIAVVAVAGALGVWRLSGSDEKFVFNPSKASMIVSSERRVKVSFSGAGKPRSGVVVDSSKRRLTLAPTNDGFTVTAVPLSMKTVEDGHVSERTALYMKLVRNCPITMLIDKSGRAQAVKGMEKYSEIERSLSTSKARVQSAAEREKTAITNWNLENADLVGRSCETGSTWTGKRQIIMPLQRDGYYCNVVYRIVGRVKSQGHDCVRIHFTYSPDKEDLLKAIAAGFAQSAKDGMMKVALTPTKADITGEGESIVDPHTGLLYSTKTTWDLKVVASVMGLATINYTQNMQENSTLRPAK